jgi:guanosine-3',5'-bis(diphosphate) 3'-pyrophosphohydrolase
MNSQELIKYALNRGITLTDDDKALIERAYEFAFTAHSEQKRHSGEPYFVHLYNTALNCARFGMDATIIAAGLLHDVLEDTPTPREELEAQFGSEIVHLIDGVTKLGKVRYQGNQRHVESLRKFFISVATDARVVMVKLADRLHNLHTLEHVRPEKRARIALESIEIYAQLASRLGMGKITTEIQDAAFPFAYPEEYNKTKQIFDNALKHTAETLDRVHRGIVKDIGSAHIRGVKIEKRVKSLFSLYKKLIKRNWNIAEVHDIIALRVITHSTEDCYRILGLIHAHYRPIPGRIKDFIALPKPNGYKSLHTSIFAGDGNSAEIQIRTFDMNHTNEYGISSHHMYKKSGTNRYQKDSFNWLADLSALESGTTDKKYAEFLKTLRTDFFQDRIFIYTPKGDVIDIPEGGTILDFAYSVHSDIGNHASGATINGKYSALKTVLKNSDVVEIITDKKAAPSSKWLSWCVSSLAKRHISNYLAKHQKGLIDTLLMR